MAKKLSILLCALLALTAPAAEAALQPAYDPSPFGVNFLKWEFLKKHPDVWKDLRQRMKIMKEAGIYWDRDGIDKNTVNPEPGKWDWAFTDKLVALCKEEGIHLTVILMGGKTPRDEATRAEYAEYVHQVVSRYKDTIKVWEIWNEPNIPSFWKQPDARLYTLLLKEAYQAAKKADPTCIVLGGSASGPGSDWFNGIYDQGGWNYCDAISMHPYAMSPDPIRQRLDLVLRTLEHAVASHGSKPIWITEVGWKAKKDRAEEAVQAVNVFQTYVISLANGIRNIDYFCMDNYDNWGLIRGSDPFDPKPSYGAVQLLTRALGSPGPAAPFEGYLKMPPNVACYVFRKPGNRRVLILWRGDEQTHAVRLPRQSGLRAADISGNPVSIARGVLTLGMTPVIVTGADAARIGKVSAAFNPNILPRDTNLLFNGSLDAAPDAAPETWKKPGSWYTGVFNAGGKEGTFATTREGRQGTTCVSISQSTGSAAWYNAIIPIEPGKKYRLTAWIKTKDATGENAAAIYWYSGNMWTPLGDARTRTITGTRDWTRVTVAGTAPRDAAFVRVHLQGSHNAGTVWFDDVAMVEE